MERTEKEIEIIRLEKRITRLFHQACSDYGLIEDGDHILIGLSGGKDSLALVELLGRRSKIYKPRFRVSAVHISVENIGYQSDTTYLSDFCQNHGVRFIHYTTRFDDSTDQRKSHCFLCSWYRRKALFEVAKQEGCSKIALGHHKDDIVETLLMNLVFQGNFGSISPKLQMQKFPMTLIRPLCLIEEKDLQRYATLCQYQKQQKLCPYEKESSRSDIKNLIQELEKFNPHVRDSLWGAMENIKTEYLPHKIAEK
ncbi:MAG: tRNA 2-thiocytidine(32) synthetase TtcA [Paludibacter sp.]|nr:tRNA 2-thiocytidine(32) synthetase TtcA [Bacteroidales bacterium]MCM1068678.1 tRNA 2-thiocytidine(32) synthetase TtcA [Prevotella sp.]MCM1353342.1 tRNA 2-thiocytidine(32) synthetase TtcA [Bacteroides sp.]MCM1442250.1 tRNA 2-thiocytidine(32) synthetase TtcA [Muribaculum sp.]MCM1481069.1 tRNA 2-thiocytidine(32) synthetase TtcA [Paludibacter sp.]